MIDPRDEDGWYEAGGTDGDVASHMLEVERQERSDERADRRWYVQAGPVAKVFSGPDEDDAKDSFYAWVEQTGTDLDPRWPVVGTPLTRPTP